MSAPRPLTYAMGIAGGLPIPLTATLLFYNLLQICQELLCSFDSVDDFFVEDLFKFLMHFY